MVKLSDKPCLACGIVFPTADEELCPACRNKARDKIYRKKRYARERLEKPEALLAEQRAWWSVNKHRRKGYQAKFYAKRRKSPWHQHRRERMRVYVRKWSKLNPGVMRAHSAFRRARELSATPSWADREGLLLFYARRPDGLDVDHIVPLKGLTAEGWPVCGLHIPMNLQYLPSKENLSKNNRMRPHEMDMVQRVDLGLATPARRMQVQLALRL